MNPNLEYGQMIMGTGKGRGYGLVDTRNLWMVIDGALIVAEAGDLSTEEMAGFKQWFVDFTQWMTDSDLAQDEFNQVNNHGTYYDMQLANYALFIGDTKLAKRAVKRTQTLRMGFQIASDGKQAFELGRTTPFHYSAFNLDAIANLARYGEQVGADVWRAKDKDREKGRGFRGALNYLVPFVLNPETWTYKELHGKPEIELALPVLLRAERAYGKDSYAAAAAKVPEILLTTQEYLALYAAIKLPAPTTFTVVDKLIWPVK